MPTNNFWSKLPSIGLPWTTCNWAKWAQWFNSTKIWIVHSYMVPSAGKGEELGVRLATSPCKNNLAMKPKEDITQQNKQQQPGKWKKAKDLRLCTWNVLTLYRPKALKMLIDELNKYNEDIWATQVVIWTGNEVLKKTECTFFCSCSANKHQLATGFIINKKVRSDDRFYAS
jgi:hypothetical protein